MSNKLKKVFASALLLALCLPFFAGCSSSKGGAGADGLYIALTGESFSPEFIELFNPLYASTDAEYAAGLMVAPSIMRYEEGEGWIPVLGTISVSKENGKTVAMVELDETVRYSNKRKLSAEEYIRTMKMLVRTNYDGYFADFYTYPIEGLVACRYNCKGLTLEDLPDFEALLSKEFAVILGEDAAKAEDAYEKLLSQTKIFGCYDGNPLSPAPDGRTFRQVLEQDSKKAPDDAYFTADDAQRVILADLCKLYADKQRDEWMIEPLRAFVMQQLQDDYEKACLDKGQRVNGEISGVHKYDATTVKVIFEKVIEDENDVIEMLNLPMLYSFMDKRSAVVGAGNYTYSGCNQGRDGKMVTLQAQNGKNLYLRTANEEDVYATIYMGQLSAAAIDGEPDMALVEEYGLKVKRFGDSAVVYHEKRTSEKELESLSVLFG
ncbi:MAG: hypothetical protein IJY89_03530 [Clostridia bacterium]|nr:hypothetical protein [Clostridia bacterium]